MDVSGSCGNVWDPKPITHEISKLGVLFTNAVDQLLAAFILLEGLVFGWYSGRGDRLVVWNEGGVLTFLLGQRMKCQVYFSEDRANIDVDKKWEQSSWQVFHVDAGESFKVKRLSLWNSNMEQPIERGFSLAGCWWSIAKFDLVARGRNWVPRCSQL